VLAVKITTTARRFSQASGREINRDLNRNRIAATIPRSWPDIRNVTAT
jgi:hypothetical protein